MAFESERTPRSARTDYRRFVQLSTRWHDNDVFGHINNVVYYAFFDTAVNRILVDDGFLDPALSPVIGLVVETRCAYFRSIAFPTDVEVGVRVDHIGRSSVRYAIGVFAGADEAAAAQGEFTHVYVERATNRPVAALPEALRKILKELEA